MLAGSAVFTLALAKSHWDFAAFSTAAYETNTYTIEEDFRNISILSETEQITVIPSQDGKSTVTFVEQENARHTVSVENGTLSIGRAETGVPFTAFSTRPTSITVCIPEGEYGTLRIDESTGTINIPGGYSFERADLKVSTGDITFNASSSGKIRIGTSTGDIRVADLDAGELEITVTTGKVHAETVRCEGSLGVTVTTGKTALSDVFCGSFYSEGTTGDITLENVIVKESLTVSRSTGDVTFKNCDAAELLVTTDTGDVTGSLLSEKVFIAKSDTGRVEVPETVTGGACRITTDTGRIEITIGQQ